MPTNYEVLTEVLEKSRQLLQSLDSSKVATDRQKIFYANLVEGVKLLVVIRHLTIPVEDARLLSTESIEALTRLLYERSLLVRQLEQFDDEEPFLRFLKTSDESMAEKWSDYERKHADVEIHQLPDYRRMAEAVDQSGESTMIYRQLSHIAHPRTSIPYSVAESTNCKQRHITPHEYFGLRCDEIVPWAALALTQILEVAKKELASLTQPENR
jgi:hypothetical protein